MTVQVAQSGTVKVGTFSPRWLADRLSGVALHVAVIGLTVAWVVPTAGLLVTSFRPFSEIATSGWWTALSPPFKFTLDNYTGVLNTSNLGTSFFNSFMITIPATVIPVTIAAFAAYAFAWMKFPGRDWIFLALVGLLAVPLQLTFIPITKAFVAWGITPDNLNSLGIPPWLGLWMAHTPDTGCRSRSTCWPTSSGRFRATSSSRLRSMAPERSLSSSESCCPSRCRRSPRWSSSSSCGSGTTSWSPSSTWAGRLRWRR